MITYRRRKRNKKPLIIAISVTVAAILAIGGYLLYGMYIRAEHPLEYRTYVEKYAAQNRLDKYLVYAVIKTESGFDPYAESNVGARGLMQIMEDTFKWVKYKSGDEEAVYYDMFNAEINIKYGCMLLGYLMDEFGNVEVAAAAYHAGRGNVNSWLADKRYSPDGVHLETIPISDTAHYVDKIKKAMSTYIKLYGGT